MGDMWLVRDACHPFSLCSFLSLHQALPPESRRPKRPHKDPVPACTLVGSPSFFMWGELV